MLQRSPDYQHIQTLLDQYSQKFGEPAPSGMLTGLGICLPEYKQKLEEAVRSGVQPEEWKGWFEKMLEDRSGKNGIIIIWD